MKMKVIGWRHSKGEFNGNAYDYVTIYTIARLEQKEAQRGSAGIEMRGEPQLVEKLKKIDFGSEVVCDIETETRATGKGQFAEMVVNVSSVVSPVAAMGGK